MTPSLLDVNVLLALTWLSHQHHQAAHGWFRRQAHPSYSPDVVTPQEAAALLVRLTAHTQHRFWNDLPALDAAPIAEFITDGFVRVDGAFPRELADEARAILIREIGRRAQRPVPSG